LRGVDSDNGSEFINDHLYRYCQSVKLAHKERVGSRLRRRYPAPQTPPQRLAACGAADPV